MDAVRLRQPRCQRFDVVRRIRHFQRLILLEEALRGARAHGLCVSCFWAALGCVAAISDATSGRSPAPNSEDQRRRRTIPARESTLSRHPARRWRMHMERGLLACIAGRHKLVHSAWLSSSRLRVEQYDAREPDKRASGLDDVGANAFLRALSTLLLTPRPVGPPWTIGKCH